MSDWYETLEGLFGQAKQVLSQGVSDRRAPARNLTMATVSPEGWPEARTVVLRAFDGAAMTLDVHTDLTSNKISSLAANARAAFHVWEPDLKVQLRNSCEVEVLKGEAVRPLWEKVPDPSRQSYGITPPPGTPIGDALAYVKEPDPATFAVLRCEIAHIDVVHLGYQHRRAMFARFNAWTGQWLSP